MKSERPKSRPLPPKRNLTDLAAELANVEDRLREIWSETHRLRQRKTGLLTELSALMGADHDGV